MVYEDARRIASQEKTNRDLELAERHDEEAQERVKVFLSEALRVAEQGGPGSIAMNVNSLNPVGVRMHKILEEMGHRVYLSAGGDQLVLRFDDPDPEPEYTGSFDRSEESEDDEKLPWWSKESEGDKKAYFERSYPQRRRQWWQFF